MSASAPPPYSKSNSNDTERVSILTKAHVPVISGVAFANVVPPPLPPYPESPPAAQLPFDKTLVLQYPRTWATLIFILLGLDLAWTSITFTWVLATWAASVACLILPCIGLPMYGVFAMTWRILARVEVIIL
ncbi:hypothetical protein HK096_008672, partial [Nowakowskiella sp. JEL0078]